MDICGDKVSPLPIGEEKEEDWMFSCDQNQLIKAIGSLLYLTNGTRQDITFTVGRMASHCKDPNIADWKRVQDIFEYQKEAKISC